MSNIYRRCGCRNPETKQPYGPDECPEMQTDQKHGSWGYSLSYKSEPDPKRPGRQRRRQFRKSGYATKRAAEKARAELLTKLADGTYVEPSKTTLAEYAPYVLARRENTGKGLRPTRWPVTAGTYEMTSCRASSGECW